MKILLSLLLIFLNSCTQTPALKSGPVILGNQYNSTGVARYFLDDIPEWANFDQSSNCFRSRTLRYFHLDSLMKSFNLTYPEAINLQGHFNFDRHEFLRPLHQSTKQVLSIKDEELLFYKALDKVKNKLLFFQPPAFSRIHFVWLDEAIKSDGAFRKFETFMASSLHDEGVPILVSACLTKDEIEQRLEKKLQSFGSIKVIGAELFSTFNSSGQAGPGLNLDLTQLFYSSQNLFFYTQEEKSLPKMFKGKIKIINY